MNIYPTNPMAIGQTNYNPYYTPMQNPVVPNYPVVQQSAPHMEIQRVNGKESAYAYNIGPNSSVILVDNLAPKIWMVTTDSSGYKAVNGFKVIPDDDESIPVQEHSNQNGNGSSEKDDLINKLTERIDILEKRLDEYGQFSQSTSRSSGQDKPVNGTVQSNDRNGQSGKGSNGSNK